MSVKTKAELRTYADANRNTNGTQSLTGATENVMWNDVIDSMATDSDTADTFVPYSYATSDVNLGDFNVEALELIAHTNDGGYSGNIKIEKYEVALPSEKVTCTIKPSNIVLTTDYDVLLPKEAGTLALAGDVLWEVDGTETQLIIADGIDMQTEGIINLKDPVANQDAATKKYVDDNIISTKEVNVSLTAAQVATLGTVPVQLIAAPSANIFINVLNASVRIIPTTPLAVGSQELFILYHHTSQEVFKLHEAGVETGTEGRWIFTRVESVEVPDAEAIMLQLSGGTNPSGAATMEVTLYYRLETY